MTSITPEISEAKQDTKSEESGPANDLPMRFFSAAKGWQVIDLREIWRCRELIWIFAQRDLKVRYRQTFIGIAWAVIQPVITIAVFGVLFQLLKSQPTTDAAPFAVTIMCSLVPWRLFAHSLTQSTQSLVSNQHLITKVFFPRAILPISTLASGMVDAAIAFIVLVIVMIYFGTVPTISILFLPVMVLLVLLTSIAIGLWMSALNALYRDIQHAIPFLIQIGFFVSPVVYETQAVIPEKWQWLYSLNPMVGILEGFRWTLIGQGPPPVMSLVVSTIFVFVVLVGGMIFFRRMERHFVDRI